MKVAAFTGKGIGTYQAAAVTTIEKPGKILFVNALLGLGYMHFLTPGQRKIFIEALSRDRKNRLCYMTRGKGETFDLCRHPLVKLLTRGNAYFIS